MYACKLDCSLRVFDFYIWSGQRPVIFSVPTGPYSTRKKDQRYDRDRDVVSQYRPDHTVPDKKAKDRTETEMSFLSTRSGLWSF